MADRRYSFTDFQVHNPASPPPGDRLDGEYARADKALSEIAARVSTSLAPDGTLKPATVGQTQLQPGLFANIVATAEARVTGLVGQAITASTQALVSADSAHTLYIGASAQNALAQDASSRSSSEAQDAASSAAEAAQSALDASISADQADDQANHAAGDAALAQDWGQVAVEWAEHMPDTIPPNILATMAITGDHWSSRWWANRAAELIAEMPVGADGPPGPPGPAGGPFVATGSTTERSPQDRAAENANVKDYGAKGDTIGLYDGTMAAGSNVLISASANFTAADIGKPIQISGSGAGKQYQKGTITEFTNAHTITVSFAAVTATPSTDPADAAIRIGGLFYYGSDDTAAITAAINAGRTGLKSVYFPPGCYWLASQTTAISLSGVTLRGEGVGNNFWPYSHERASLVLLSNTATAAFSGVGGTSIRDMAFYYPAIDPSQATPVSLPPLFEADGASGGYVDNWFSRMRVIAADTVFHATVTGSFARSFLSDCLVYGVRNVFLFHNGYADTIQPVNCYFGPGAMGSAATAGSAFLQKYTRLNGAVLRYDIGAGSYALADGLVWSGGIVQNYRHGIQIVSGTVDVSTISNILFDGTGSVLSVSAGARIVSTSITGGEIYSLGDDPAAADNVFDFAAGAAVSDLSITGMRITYALGHVIWDVAGALQTLSFVGNSVSNWGQSTTAGAYYVYGVSAGGAGRQNFTGNIFYGNRGSRPSSSIIGLAIESSSGVDDVVIAGNAFDSCTRPLIIGGVGGSVTISGNTSTASGAPILDTSTTNVVYGVNNWDIAPVLQPSTRGISVEPTRIGYLASASGSHQFSIGGTERVRIDSAGNVGIGTTAPGYKLHVHLAANENVMFHDDGGVAGIGSLNDAPAFVPLSINALGDVYLCRAAGRVGVATTTPHAALEVRGTTAAGASVAGISSGPNGADSTTALLNFWDYGVTVQAGSISRTGTNQVSYNTASDQRLKQDIRDSKRGLEALLAIKVSDYKMGKTAQQGLLAQDVAKLYPEAVHEGGKDPNLEPWMIDYGRLTPLLIRAIQDQQQVIDRILKQIDQLKGRRDAK